MSVSVARTVDLRRESVDDALDRVERSLRVALDRKTLVVKRRSVGAGTDRGTWVRIERRGVDRIGVQGWNGAECAESLTGVNKPAWFASTAWRDTDDNAMWRADETALLPGKPVGPSVLAKDPNLPEAWWASLNSSLNALAGHRTNRIATPDTETITQNLVTESIGRAFPDSFDTTVREWVPAHADLNWANVTGPEFCLFDWEDWGMAPRGLDAASLWGNSLAVPALADRVHMERRDDFASRDGKLMTLFVCSKILGPYADPEDPRLTPARAMADQAIDELHTG
ncbi:hypothetical protein OG782_21815 [Streptomyces sp. NBC_00876]|uniref:hypothetical protein n=1 Tax=Streptomyces sp. NBC_00876 TaxID=2975853 RepID=UPI00386A2EDA|nr:hypothetical protein OG782_21815 [Streptomyces sp. NBC_00876]